MTAADVSAGIDELRHCDLNDLSRRTAVESKSNRSCNNHTNDYDGDDDDDDQAYCSPVEP